MLRIRVTIYSEVQGEPESHGTEEAKVRTRVTTIRSVPLGIE